MLCPVCNSSQTYEVVDVGYLPLSVLRLPTKPDKNADRFPIVIEQCVQCGHAFNAVYDEGFDQCKGGGCTMYNNGAEWRHHLKDVAWIVQDLCGEGVIVEIGAGRGEFAALFAEYDYIAYEPSEDAIECSEKVVTRKRFFDSASMKDEHPDLIILRHVLEHFVYPREFIEMLADSAHECGISPYLLIEVPNIQPAFDAGRLEDWVYEHPQHFTPDSLQTLLELSGWHVTDVETLYNDEVLLVVADLKDLKVPITFKISGALDRLKLTGMRLIDPVVWGGAGKCANLINLLNPKGAIVVDSDERKWGCFVPGTDYEIQSPEILKRIKPKQIIVATTWRTADIAIQIAALNIETEILNIVDGELTLYEDPNV